MDSVTARLLSVRDNVARICASCGRAAESVRLLVVTKQFPAEAIEPLLACGHRDFAENRVQEAMAKWPALKVRYADVKLHLVGSLQSNKAREAVGLFDSIHSLDRPNLASAIAEASRKAGACPQLFVQINTGGEEQKSGASPAEAAALIGGCREDLRLEIHGLMCIPPVDQPPSPHFALLAKIARKESVPLLSMGMSSDYEAAIRLGATHVRIGGAIMGSRA